MSWILLLGAVGLAAAAHLGRNHLAARALPGLRAHVQGRLGEGVSLEGGAVTLDHRYDLRLAEVVVSAAQGRLELSHAALSGVAGAAWSRGARPPRLETAAARLVPGDLPPIDLDFTATPGADPSLLVAGELTTREPWIPAASVPGITLAGTLEVTPAGEVTLRGVLEAGASRLTIEVTGDQAGVVGPGQVSGCLDLSGLGPWLPADLQPRGTAEVEYRWSSLEAGEGQLSIGDLLVPSFEALANGAATAGFPPLPAEVPGTLAARLRHTGETLHVRDLDLVAEPLRVAGEVTLGEEVAGELQVTLDNRYLAAGPAALADLDVEARTRSTLTVEGTRGAPGGRVALDEPLALALGPATLEVAALEVGYTSGDPAPTLVRAEGLARAPGPRGGTWMVPLRLQGKPDPAAPLAGDVVVAEAFLQVPGAPPPIPPLDFEGELRIFATGAAKLDGALTAGASALTLSLCRDADGGLEGTRIHGAIDPELVRGTLPDTFDLGLPEGGSIMGEATATGTLATPRGRLELFTAALSPGPTGGPSLPLRQVALKLDVDPRKARIEALEAQTLGGRLRVQGDVDLGSARPGGLEVMLEGIRVEQIPTGPDGAREVAPHLKAALSGTLELSARDTGWEAEGPVTFEGGELLFLRPLSKEAEAAGYPPLGVRAEGPAPARASFRGDVLRFNDLVVAAAPLAARGWIEFGGAAGFAGDLALDVAAPWLRSEDAPVVPTTEEETLHTRLAFGAGGIWGLDLQEPCRVHGDEFAAKLTAARLIGVPGTGTQMAVEELTGTAWIEDIAGGRLHLPFTFTGSDQPSSSRWLAGDVGVEGARLRGAGLDVPPMDAKGTMAIEASGAAELQGRLKTARSRLKLELARAADGDLEGSRAVGTLAFDELHSLLPSGLRVATPDKAHLRVEATAHGAPPDWTAELELSTQVMAISGPDLPDVELGEPYLTARVRAREVRIRRLEADLLGGEAEVSGKVALTTPPRFDLELQVRKLVAEDIPTDTTGGRALADLVAGRLSGQLELAGTPEGPHALAGHGSLTLNEARWLFLRDVPDTARLGPLPVLGRGPGTADLALEAGTLRVERFQGRVDGLRFEGDVEVDVDGPLAGLFHAHLSQELMAKSPLLAIPAAALGEVAVPIRLGGSWRDPQVDVQVAEVVEGMVGKSRIGSTLKGAVDTMWSAFGGEGMAPNADTDALVGRILAGGPDADDCIEALLDAGLDEDDIEELVQDYARRRRRS